MSPKLRRSTCRLRISYTVSLQTVQLYCSTYRQGNLRRIQIQLDNNSLLGIENRSHLLSPQACRYTCLLSNPCIPSLPTIQLNYSTCR